MSEWREIKLGDLGTVVTGKTPSKNNPGDWGNETLFITPSDYGNYRKWADDSIRKLSTDGAERLSNKVLPVGSILVTCIGSDMGKVVLNKKDAITNQQINSIIPNTEVVNSDFAYYLLVDLYETLRIYGGDGTAVPIVNKGDFEKIDSLIPEKDEQNAIAEVLSSLDDKIDLLHRQNQTLEQMAETLFRQWFVEEAEFVSDRQLIIGDLIESVSITHKFPNKEIVFLNTSDIYLGDVLTHSTTEVIGLPGQAKKTIKKGDILFSEIRPANGRYAFIDFEAENYVVSTKLMVLRNKNVVSQEFIYFYLINPKTIQELQLIAESRSGTFPQITFDNLKDFRINIPSNEKLLEAESFCKEVIKKIKSNRTQIRTLTALRDTLLPKLMSGEVRVKMDATAKMEEA